MRLPHHGRFDFSAIKTRRPYDWPEGKRLAVYIGLNIEHFAFGTGLGHAISTELPPPDPRTFSWRDYGNRVGVWRIFDLLDQLGHEHTARRSLLLDPHDQRAWQLDASPVSLRLR